MHNKKKNVCSLMATQLVVLCQALGLLEGLLPDGEEVGDEAYMQRRRRQSSAWGPTHRMQTPDNTTHTFSPTDTPRSLAKDEDDDANPVPSQCCSLHFLVVYLSF